MMSRLRKLVKNALRPFYSYITKPIYRRVLSEVESEIQQINSDYIEFQAKYVQQISDELVRLNKVVEELKSSRVLESNSVENE